MKQSGLYVHIPFCSSRCIYCGFYSTTGHKDKDVVQKEYVEALLKEFSLHPEYASFRTVYLGGGTPSTLPLSLLDRLFSGIFSAASMQQVSEVTMECNPDDVTPEFARWLGSSPVNRVSMGAQTFSASRLRWLHRRHNPQQVADAVSLLRRNGIRNISIDLMFGFPGQTIDDWAYDISRILSLAPEHISAYSLMYEEGTPLYAMLQRGDFQEIDDELSLRMYDMLIDRLTAAGYEHYEISNFSLPGHRSMHNSSYWRQVPYLGLGAAAHSYDGATRRWNVADLTAYIHGIEHGSSISDYEEIDARTRYNDIVTTALRTREGVLLSDLTADQRTYILSQSAPHLRSRRLALSGDSLHLTRSGIYTSDDIMSDLIML